MSQESEKLREFDRGLDNPRPMSEQEQLDNWFSYHPPLNGQADTYARLRAGAKQYAELIVASCPPSADRTAALRKLREVVYTANASIACGGK
jgi:hypothetical protein